MVTKCFNSSCSASFRFLHSGKLFQFEKRPQQTEDTAIAPWLSIGTEFFWLCEECAEKFTLVSDHRGGVRVLRLKQAALAAATL